MLKYLGIELGKPWNREAVNPVILEEMKSVAQAIGLTINLSFPIVGGRQVNGWTVSPYAAGNAGPDYMLAAAVAVIGLTANATDQAIYYPGYFDIDNELLTGKKRYTMTFKEPMQFADVVPPGFWSITMYDGVTHYTVPNPINRYKLGSDDELKKNPDGIVHGLCAA